MIQNTYQVKGMHCASCASIITRDLAKLAGVQSVDVNVATEQAQIEFDPNQVSITVMNQSLEKLGYSLEGKETLVPVADIKTTQAGDILAGERLKVEASLPVALWVFALMLWEITARIVPSVPNLAFPMEWLNVVLFLLSTTVLFWIGKPFLLGVVRFVRFRVANMDTLIGIGTLAAYFYSSLITLFPSVRDWLRLPSDTYFDVTICD